MPFVVGALGSRPARSKGLGRQSAGGREPKGKRHAVDSDTGMVACGTRDSLRVFEDWPWAPDGECCSACEAAAPFEEY
jgi:hypothetical protein